MAGSAHLLPVKCKNHLHSLKVNAMKIAQSLLIEENPMAKVIK